MNQKVTEWALQVVASWLVVCVLLLGAGFSSTAHGQALAWDNSTKAWFGDVNGDGLTDVLLQPLTGNPTLTFGQVDPASPIDSALQVSLPALFSTSDTAYGWSQQDAVLQLLDVNGDTRADIFVWHPVAQRAWVFLGQASTPIGAAAPPTDFHTFDFSSAHQTLTASDVDDIGFSFDVRLTVIDSNQDGLDELFIQRVNGFSHHLLRSDDSQLVIAQTLPYHTPWAKQRTECFVVADYNGDGRDDIMAVARTEGNPHYLVLTDSKGLLGDGQQLAHYLSDAPWSADVLSMVADNVDSTQGAELIRMTNMAGDLDENDQWVGDSAAPAGASSTSAVVVSSVAAGASLSSDATNSSVSSDISASTDFSLSSDISDSANSSNTSPAFTTSPSNSHRLPLLPPSMIATLSSRSAQVVLAQTAQAQVSSGQVPPRLARSSTPPSAASSTAS